MFSQQYRATLSLSVLGGATTMTNHSDRTTGARWNGRYLARHHWDGATSLRESIIKAVATATGMEAETVAAHYGAEHSQTVERLFGDPVADESRSYGLVRFVLYGSLVTVHSDGRLIVEFEDNEATQQSLAT